MTTSYTRIRLPIVVQDAPDYSTEKLVLLTSPDRAIVAARGSRTIHENTVLGDFEHNTPLVLYMLNHIGPCSFSIVVRSADGIARTFEIAYRQDEKKFTIPEELDVKSTKFPSMMFDAVLPSKLKRK